MATMLMRIIDRFVIQSSLANGLLSERYLFLYHCL